VKPTALKADGGRQTEPVFALRWPLPVLRNEIERAFEGFVFVSLAAAAVALAAMEMVAYCMAARAPHSSHSRSSNSNRIPGCPETYPPGARGPKPHNRWRPGAA